jgi:RNase P subunit RPR2
MAFRLSDDGTLDTVVVCEECGEELRYNHNLSFSVDENTETYQEFINWCLKDAEKDHVCEEGEVA